MGLSDAKFIAASMERARVRPLPTGDGADYTALKGIGDRQLREAEALLPDAQGEFEPVSFMHPETNRRVYGWLVAVDPSGNARIEIGDGQFAVVPPEDIRRLGMRENREQVKAQLRKAIGQVSTDGFGVRADMRETLEPVPVGPEEDGVHLIAVQYSTSIGPPTEHEVVSYVERFHPTASIVELDSSMPGRVGIAIKVDKKDDDDEKKSRFERHTQTVESKTPGMRERVEHALQNGQKLDMSPKPDKPKPTTPKSRSQHMAVDREAADREAEMEAAHGGEVQEVLDPKDVVERDVQLSREAQTTLAPMVEDAKKKLFNQVLQRDPSAKHITPDQAARFLLDNRNLDIVTKAMDVARRASPKLWSMVSNMTAKGQSVPNIEQSSTNRPQTRPPVGTGQPGPLPSTGPSAPAGVPQGWSPPGSGFSAPGPAAPGTPGPGQTQTTPSRPQSRPATSPQLQWAMDQVKKSPEGAALPYAKQQELAQQYLKSVQENAPQNQEKPGESGPEGVHVGPTASKRSAFLTKKAYEGGGTPTMENTKHFEANPGYQHLLRDGLPPSMTQIFNAMRMNRFARRGDYTMATVTWEPKVFEGRSPHAIKNYVVSFVKAKCGMNKQGTNFGIIGKIYVLSMEKGSAKVQFASEFPGPTALVVKEE